MTRSARRKLAGVITLGLAAAATLWWAAGQPALQRTAYLSGWALLGLCLFLAAYNGRKKLPYPPLGSAAAWMQLHIYGGLLAVVIYILHTAGRWPQGGFEIALALLFYGTALSGVAGLILSRLVPRRLTLAGDEVIYERIPAFREELRLKADALVMHAVARGGATTLAEFYARRLKPYFAGPAFQRSHLTQSNRPLRSLLGQLEDLRRYFDDAEKACAAELAELIRHKNRLDYHAALQGLLKKWLFVHIPLTAALLISSAVHVLLVYAFGGDA